MDSDFGIVYRFRFQGSGMDSDLRGSYVDSEFGVICGMDY